MIGVVVATHGNLAQEMIRTAEAVVGKLAQVAPVSVVATAPDVRHLIEEAIRSVDTGDRLGDLFSRIVHIVMPADRHRGELRQIADNHFRSVDEFRRKLPVRDHHHADHRCLS